MVINPAEQPTDIDRRAMEHWSAMGDWVFCDGFGSGTTLIAALECGRSIVATEPDESQWMSACARLDHEIGRCLRFDEASFRRKIEQEKADREEKKAAERKEKASQKAQSLKAKAKKKAKVAEADEPEEAEEEEDATPVIVRFLLNIPLETEG